MLAGALGSQAGAQGGNVGQHVSAGMRHGTWEVGSTWHCSWGLKLESGGLQCLAHAPSSAAQCPGGRQQLGAALQVRARIQGVAAPSTCPQQWGMVPRGHTATGRSPGRQSWGLAGQCCLAHVCSGGAQCPGIMQQLAGAPGVRLGVLEPALAS